MKAISFLNIFQNKLIKEKEQSKRWAEVLKLKAGLL